MSFRVVAFPYTPPPSASFSNMCLQVDLGDRVRVVRRVASWAIFEAGGRLGLFPFAFTRDECQGGPTVRKVRQEPLTIAPLVLEESIEVADGDVEKNGLTLAAHHDDVDGNEKWGPHSDSGVCRSIDVTDIKQFVEIDTNGNDVADDSIKLVEATFSAPGRRTTLGGTTKEGQEVVPRSVLGMGSGEGRAKPAVPHRRHGWRGVADEDKEREQLQKQYVQLHAELTWLSTVTDRVENERSRVIYVRHHGNDDDCDKQKKQLGKERDEADVIDVSEQLEPFMVSKAADMQRCINRLRSILLAHEVADSLSTSAHVTSGVFQRGDVNVKALEKDDIEVYDLPEEILEQDPEAASEARALKECILCEQDTLRVDSEEQDRLLTRIEQLRCAGEAADKKLRALQESEEALEAVAPPGTYTVLSTDTGGSINDDGGSSNGRTFDGGSLPPVESMQSSVTAQLPHAAGVKVVMREGFVWPASLPGLTTEEQDTASLYQGIIRKYEAKQERLRQEREAAGSTISSPSILERLRQTLSAGDVALNALLRRTRELKAFVKVRPEDAGAGQMQPQ